MFNRQLSYRFDDRVPKVFTPRVAPDPEAERMLTEKFARSRDQLQEDPRFRNRRRLLEIMSMPRQG